MIPLLKVLPSPLKIGLTHGAVSHRLRALEAELGLTLFTRLGNSMAATPDAQRLLAAFDNPLDAMMAFSRGTLDEGFDGVTEIWWDSVDASIAAAETEDGGKAGLRR